MSSGPFKSGGMGAVYIGQRGDRTFAIKFPTATHLDPGGAERFRREALLLSKVDDPHVVKVIESGETEDGLQFLAMEHLRGRDLAGEPRPARGPLPVDEACRLVIQACR